jgi:DNA-binding NarL/FixJ family response regulator
MADDHIDKGSWSGNGAEGNGHGSEGEGNRHGATPSPRPVGGKEPMTTLLILEDESTRSSTLSMMRGIAGVELVGERHELRSGLLLARQKGARLVVLDLPKDYEESLQAAAQFKQDSPDTALFLVGGSLDPQFLLKAIRAGASEVLKKPLDRAILQEAIERVSRSGAARRSGCGRPAARRRTGKAVLARRVRIPCQTRDLRPGR